MVSTPPSLLAFVMHEPAPTGGEVFFIDGVELVLDLRNSGLTSEEIRGIYLHAHDGSAQQPVFEEIEPTYWIVRYRDDGVAGPRSDVKGVAERFKDLVSSAPHVLRLGAGDGYVLNNRRWLHGRTSFTGSRQASRLLYSTPAVDGFCGALKLPELER